MTVDRTLPEVVPNTKVSGRNMCLIGSRKSQKHFLFSKSLSYDLCRLTPSPPAFFEKVASLS